MKLIKRDTDYAVRAVCYMANKKGSIVSVSEMVKELKIPRPFLRKILQRLNREGMLSSYKGVGGGFKLAKAAKEIFITDLIEIFQGKFKLNECLFKKKNCPNVKYCALKRRIDKLEAHVVSELNSVTIDELIKER